MVVPGHNHDSAWSVAASKWNVVVSWAARVPQIVGEVLGGLLAPIEPLAVGAAYLKVVQPEADAAVAGLLVRKRRHGAAHVLPRPHIAGHGDLLALRVDDAWLVLGPRADEDAARDVVAVIGHVLARQEGQPEPLDEVRVLRLALSPLLIDRLCHRALERGELRRLLYGRIEQQVQREARFTARHHRAWGEQDGEGQDADRCPE